MVTSSAPLFVSSGDLVADRRYRWAIDHARRGDFLAAADILAQTVELAPGFATAWFALGAIRDQLGEGAGEATPEMSETYVRRLFDQHAPDFDTTMLERLHYRGPQLLLRAVQSVAGERLRIGSMLDLGCGTGLGGAAFRPYVDWLVGVDLAPAMVAAARAKGLYDRLATDELVRFLRAEADSQAHFHLVLAADVFVYCGELFSIAAAVARVLAPDGFFAFTVERLDGPGVQLRETLRYAHSSEHVRDALDRAGLATKILESAATRSEKGVPVAGLVVVARRQHADRNGKP